MKNSKEKDVENLLCVSVVLARSPHNQNSENSVITHKRPLGAVRDFRNNAFYGRQGPFCKTNSKSSRSWKIRYRQHPTAVCGRYVVNVLGNSFNDFFKCVISWGLFS